MRVVEIYDIFLYLKVMNIQAEKPKFYEEFLAKLMLNPDDFLDEKTLTSLWQFLKKERNAIQDKVSDYDEEDLIRIFFLKSGFAKRMEYGPTIFFRIPFVILF